MDNRCLPQQTLTSRTPRAASLDELHFGKVWHTSEKKLIEAEFQVAVKETTSLKWNVNMFSFPANSGKNMGVINEKQNGSNLQRVLKAQKLYYSSRNTDNVRAKQTARTLIELSEGKQTDSRLLSKERNQWSNLNPVFIYFLMCKLISGTYLFTCWKISKNTFYSHSIF